MKKVLNLGAGNALCGDAVNHDIKKHRPEIDIVWDLNVLPWPWENNTFSHIIAWAVFEHLDIALLQAIDECWRILKPEGTIRIKLPHWKNKDSYNDPTHRYAVEVGIFDVFDPTTERGQKYNFYTSRKWKIQRVGLSSSGSCVVATLQVLK